MSAAAATFAAPAAEHRGTPRNSGVRRRLHRTFRVAVADLDPAARHDADTVEVDGLRRSTGSGPARPTKGCAEGACRCRTSTETQPAGGHRRQLRAPRCGPPRRNSSGTGDATSGVLGIVRTSAVGSPSALALGLAMVAGRFGGG